MYRTSVRSLVQLFLLLVASTGTCALSARYVSRLRPISKAYPPWSFIVVAKDATGKYSPFELCDYSFVHHSTLEMQEHPMTKGRVPIIWNETVQNYDYYIPEGSLGAITKTVSSEFQRLRGTRESIEIRILEDDVSNRRQTILLTRHFPDAGTFRHVYEAAQGEVEPLQYGEFSKDQAFGVVPLSGGVILIAGYVLVRIHERRHYGSRKPT